MKETISFIVCIELRTIEIEGWDCHFCEIRSRSTLSATATPMIRVERYLSFMTNPLHDLIIKQILMCLLCIVNFLVNKHARLLADDDRIVFYFRCGDRRRA